MRRANFIIVATVLVAVVTPNLASGSGFLVARFGGEHGHPTTHHPAAIYFNPAGLALNKGTHIYAEGLLGFRTVTYTRPVAAIDSLARGGIADYTWRQRFTHGTCR